MASLRFLDALQNQFSVVYIYIQAFELESIYTPYPNFDGQKKSAYEGLTNPNWFMGPPVLFD